MWKVRTSPLSSDSPRASTTGFPAWAELVRLKVNVIVAGGPAAIQAAKRATETIPIVMSAVADPVAAGFVATLARPGGNITGDIQYDARANREAAGADQGDPSQGLSGLPARESGQSQLRTAAATRAGCGQDIGIRLQPLEAREFGEIDSAFAAITSGSADAIIVLTDTVLLDHRTRIIDHAVQRRLPTVFGVSEFTEAGGLLAYGPSLSDGVRQAATYVDKILKGAKPADLPIGQPTTFELVVNLKTAKALGLTVPQSVLQRADRVIR